MEIASMNQSLKSSLFVVHMSDNLNDRKEFKAIFPRIERALTSFFKKNFSYQDPESRRGDFEPQISFRLAQFQSPEALATGLITQEHLTTTIGSTAMLLVLQNHLTSPGIAPGSRLTSMAFHDVTFPDWLNRFLPHIPVILLTRGEALSIRRVKGWEYESKESLLNPDDFILRLHQHFSKWWEPTFSLALEKYGKENGARSWHTPGHNAGNAFYRSPFQSSFYRSFGPMAFRTDLSVSVTHLGDLSEPDMEAPLKWSRQRSSAIFGSEETFYITNGTSTSNKAMLMTLLKPGEMVLLDRNCHKSVHQAVVMSGALPLYLTPAYNHTLGIWCPLSLDTLRMNLSREYPDALRPRALILTTCTYEGVLYPMADIASLCEEYGVLFFADEAWAPHLRFHPQYTSAGSTVSTSDRSLSVRCNAMDGGAHFAVQSTHKALAAFSQASMIHISNRFRFLLEADKNPQWDWLRRRFSFQGKGSYADFSHELQEMLRYWHSTSPHYPMLATLDRAGIQMRLEGTRLLQERLEWVEELQNEFREIVPSGCSISLKHIVGPHRLDDFPNYTKDPLKMVLGFRDRRSGTSFIKALERAQIKPEKTTFGCVEFLVTIGTYRDHLENLLGVVAANAELLGSPGDDELKPDRFDFEMASGQVEIFPRAAAISEGELVPLNSSRGRVCAQFLVPYPPGIPVFIPGMRVSRSMINLVREVATTQGVHEVHGLFTRDDEIYVKVMRKDEEVPERRRTLNFRKLFQ
jgi:arginine decarboxylase